MRAPFRFPFLQIFPVSPGEAHSVAARLKRRSSETLRRRTAHPHFFRTALCTGENSSPGCALPLLAGEQRRPGEKRDHLYPAHPPSLSFRLSRGFRPAPPFSHRSLRSPPASHFYRYPKLPHNIFRSPAAASEFHALNITKPAAVFYCLYRLTVSIAASLWPIVWRRPLRLSATPPSHKNLRTYPGNPPPQQKSHASKSPSDSSISTNISVNQKTRSSV